MEPKTDTPWYLKHGDGVNAQTRPDHERIAFHLRAAGYEAAARKHDRLAAMAPQ